MFVNTIANVVNSSVEDKTTTTSCVVVFKTKKQNLLQNNTHV